MKKIFAIIIALALSAAIFALTALADDETDAATSETLTATHSAEEPALTSNGTENNEPDDLSGLSQPDLFSLWEENGYPDDIGGVSVYTTGFDPSKPDDLPGEYWVIYVVSGTGDDRKAELKTLVGSDNVKFIECKYSFNHLKAVMDEIISDKGLSESGIVGGGVIIKDNAISVEILEENYDEVSAALSAKYGDMVIAVVGNNTSASVGEDELLIASNPNAGLNTFVIVAIVCFSVLILCAAALFAVKTARARTLLDSNGGAHTKPSVTSKAVEKAVSDSAQAPSEKLYDDIVKKL